jgi:hypothetical protein
MSVLRVNKQNSNVEITHTHMCMLVIAIIRYKLRKPSILEHITFGHEFCKIRI